MPQVGWDKDLILELRALKRVCITALLILNAFPPPSWSEPKPFSTVKSLQLRRLDINGSQVNISIAHILAILTPKLLSQPSHDFSSAVVCVLCSVLANTKARLRACV